MKYIFDFTLTISKQRTFFLHAFEDVPQAETHYEDGKQEAKTNLKRGISAWLKHDDQNNLSAIATHHNNPDYIAGYIAVLLNKELTLVEQRISNDNEGMIAINQYAIDGIKNPFFIAYIPLTGLDCELARQKLVNKNPQIEFLRQVMLDKHLISKDSIIDFYDDTLVNFEGAKTLDYVNSFHVDGADSTFTIDATHLTPRGCRYQVAMEGLVRAPLSFELYTLQDKTPAPPYGPGAMVLFNEHSPANLLAKNMRNLFFSADKSVGDCLRTGQKSFSSPIQCINV